MRYYRVPVRQTDEGIEPDIASVAAWVGNTNAARTAYLIKTPANLQMQAVTDHQIFGEIRLNPNVPERALETVAGAMGLDVDEVLNVWHVQVA